MSDVPMLRNHQKVLDSGQWATLFAKPLCPMFGSGFGDLEVKELIDSAVENIPSGMND